MLLHKSVEFDSRVRREASALAADGHQVVVLELAAATVGARSLDGFERRSVLPPHWTRRRLPSFAYRPLMLAWFVRGLVANRPDVVHAHDAAMLLPGIIGARLTGAQLVYDSHELATSVPYREPGWGWLVGTIERLVVPRCNAVITVSAGIAARLRERYGLACSPVVIRNVSALSVNGRGGLRARLGLGDEEPLVLYQGAPAPSRGCEVLVDAVARLDGVHLAFLGDPEPGYVPQLLAQVETRGIADRVSFLGSISLSDLLSHTAEADVGVTLLQDTCENHRLALPNKLFEYIAAGLPVVASALPETERLLAEYGVGWCVPPDNPSAVASALHSALLGRDDPTLRRRIARAADDLQWAREQTLLLDLYRQLGTDRGTNSRRPLLLLVRNTVIHDARVLRAAHTAMGRGLDPVVIGVADAATPSGEVVIDGIRVRRVAAPRTPGRGAPRARGPRQPPEVANPELNRATPGRLRRIARGLAFTVQSVAIARRLRPAVVHANDWNTMWAGVGIRLLCGSRLIYDSHELWTKRNGRWESPIWLSACETLFLRLADEVITTSPGHAAFLEQRYQVKRPLVIRNIPEWTTRGEPQLCRPPVVVYVGGLMPGRGLEQMIDSLPYLPDVRLRALGPSRTPYRDELLARAELHGVGDRVELAEPVPPARIQSELAGAAIGLCLIQPICRSYELSLPNKLLEYAAAGIPILGSDLPVIAAVINENDLGVVVAPSDPRSIAEGIRSLLVSERRREAISGCHRFTAANSWERESGQLAEIYGGLRAGSR